MSNTRTATISSLDETATKLSALFGSSLAAAYNDYEDVTILNASTVAITVASMEGGRVPIAGDYRTLDPGAELLLKRISSKDVWIASTDDGGTHSVQFVGTPA